MGSKTSYGSGIIAKKLTVIGPGYWLAENPNTQAIKDTAQVTSLTFNSGSEGSIAQGLYFRVVAATSAYTINYRFITINTDSITIAKNYFYIYRYGNYTQGINEGISIYGDRNYIKIQQNWIQILLNDLASGYNGTACSIHFTGIPINCYIQNNFIYGVSSGPYGEAHNIKTDLTDIANDLKIYNNVIWGNMSTFYTEQLNNIYVSGTYLGGADLMMYNLCSDTQYPADAGMFNQQNTDMSTVFTDYTTMIDNGYALAPGSPATGAGINGGDCGLFSFDTGGYPYVLSGIPAIPAIYEATVGPVSGTTIPVTIKASSHNEHK